MKNDYEQFDIVLVDLGDDFIDGEQGGIRPCVIVQNNCGNMYSITTLVMPLTKQIKKLNQPTHTLLRKSHTNGLTMDSMVLGECLRQISEKRIIKYIGSITKSLDKKEIKRVYDANFGMGGM